MILYRVNIHRNAPASAGTPAARNERRRRRGRIRSLAATAALLPVLPLFGVVTVFGSVVLRAVGGLAARAGSVVTERIRGRLAERALVITGFRGTSIVTERPGILDVKEAGNQGLFQLTNRPSGIPVTERQMRDTRSPATSWNAEYKRQVVSLFLREARDIAERRVLETITPRKKQRDLRSLQTRMIGETVVLESVGVRHAFDVPYFQEWLGEEMRRRAPRILQQARQNATQLAAR